MDNEMKGVLFKNDKGDNEKRPDIKGELTIDSVTYQLAAWKNTSANGNVYYKLKAEKPEEQVEETTDGLFGGSDG